MEFNKKFKLIGFTRNPYLAANIMIFSTGKMIKIGLRELIESEISDDLNKNENREIYRKLYGDEKVATAYELSDRHERSWQAYFVICLMLAIIFIYSNITGIKPVEIKSLNLIIPAAIFTYPLSFILVDILNEFYGLRLARRAILMTFIANFCFVFFLWTTTRMPALSSWPLDEAYTMMVSGVTAVLVASSVSYLVSENINSYLLCKIKALTESNYLFFRVVTSTIIASAIDSVLFISIAFYGVLSRDIMERMIFAQFSIKFIYAIIGIAPVYGARWLFNRYIHQKTVKQDPDSND